MEGAPKSKLSGQELALFKNLQRTEPNLTEDDFIELRELALQKVSPGIKKFFSKHGVLMEEAPDPEEVREFDPEH
jgi:hypothetical protein